MRIRLIDSITLRSEPLSAGTEIDVDDLTGQQLIAAGQAEPTAAAGNVKPAKPTKE